MKLVKPEDPKIQCRFPGCKETFNHRKQRIRHEAEHDTRAKETQKKTYPCICCDPPRLFTFAKDRRNHKYFQANKLEFKCSKCSNTLSTK